MSCTQSATWRRWRDLLEENEIRAVAQGSPSEDKHEAAGYISDDEGSACLHGERAPNGQRTYRIKAGYCLRDLCGEGLVIPVSNDAIQENRMAILSPVGSFLWGRLGTGQTAGQLLEAVLAEYDVSPDEARSDIDEFISELNAHNYLVIEEESAQ